ncbi:porin [Reyranella sp.]|uniref:porin n=1 Tax=Reyranella sp. TaxID=1929291 RepID=UPI003D12A9A9
MMKKLLLGSTALVAGGLMAAPAMAADPIKIGVGGYYQFYALAGGIEGVYAPDGTSLQYKGLQFIQEGEIHFIGQSKLDNGTTVGLTVELEGWNNSVTTSTGGHARQIDEAFLFAFGDWGRLEFGSRDQASYRMYYGAPSALLGWGFFQHNSNFNWASAAMLANPAQGAATFFTIGGQFQDVNRINYFTPRFMGLQVGVGYAPKININPNAVASRGMSVGPGLGGGICGTNDATTASNCPTNDNSYQDVFDVGANYLNKFGDVTVALFGAWMYANFVPSFNNLAANNANTVTGANLAPWKQWVVGVQFGFAGFTVGGSYGYDNNGIGGNYYTGVAAESRKWAASIMYETGPWQMSLGWGHVNTDNGNGASPLATVGQGTTSGITTVATAGSSSGYFGTNPLAGAAVFGGYVADKYELGVNYALGPGIKLVGGGILWNVGGPVNGTQGQSWALMMGMDLRF